MFKSLGPIIIRRKQVDMRSSMFLTVINRIFKVQRVTKWRKLFILNLRLS